MSAEYDFVQRQYDLASTLKAGNRMLENEIYSALEPHNLNQVSNHHFEYLDTHFSFDVKEDSIDTAIYGEKTVVGAIEEAFDEIINRFNESILTSQTLEH